MDPDLTQGFREEFNQVPEIVVDESVTKTQKEIAIELDAKPAADENKSFLKDEFLNDKDSENKDNIVIEQTNEEAILLETQNKITAVNNILGTNFQTQEEIDGYKERLANLAKQEEENKIIRSKIVNPYANDSVRRFNEFSKETNISDMGVFQKIDKIELEKADPIDVMVLSKILKDPKYASQEHLLRKSLEKQYDIDSIYDDEDKELAIFKMNMDADSAREHINSIKSKIPLHFEDNTAKILEERKELEQSWSTKLDTITDSVKSIVISSIDKDGKPVELLNFNVKKEDIGPYLNQVQASFIDQGVEYSDENREKLIKIATDFYKSDNISKMIEAAKNVADSEGQLKTMKKIHNPSSLTVTSKATVKENSGKSFDDWTERFIKGEAV